MNLAASLAPTAVTPLDSIRSTMSANALLHEVATETGADVLVGMQQNSIQDLGLVVVVVGVHPLYGRVMVLTTAEGRCLVCSRHRGILALK